MATCLGEVYTTHVLSWAAIRLREFVQDDGRMKTAKKMAS